MSRLFAQLELAHGDGSFARLFRMLTKVDLLMLDDLAPDRLTAGQRRDFMEIIEERHGRGATLVSSQLPVKAWHDLIADPIFADAILDASSTTPTTSSSKGRARSARPTPTAK
jgi:DNA replication protein DnaC